MAPPRLGLLGPCICGSHSTASSHKTCHSLTHLGMHSPSRGVMESYHNCPHLGVKANVSQRASKTSHLMSYHFRFASLLAIPQGLCTCYSFCLKCCSPRCPHGSLHHFHLGFCSNGCSSKVFYHHPIYITPPDILFHLTLDLIFFVVLITSCKLICLLFMDVCPLRL